MAIICNTVLSVIVFISVIQLIIATSEAGSNSTQPVDAASTDDALLHPHHGFGADFDHNVTQPTYSSLNATSQESAEDTSDSARFPPLISAAILQQILSGKPIKITLERETKLIFRNYGEKGNSKKTEEGYNKGSTSTEEGSFPKFRVFRRTGNADVPVISK